MQNQDFDKTKALTFSSIMSAISIVLILITFFSGDIGLFLILILPLCASLVAVKVNFKYSLIYFLSTFLISCIDFQVAIFVVIPSLFSGIVFGKFIKLYIQGYYIIIIDAICLLILQIASTYLVNAIYQIDIIKTTSQILKLNEEVFENGYFLFLFMLSLIESSLSYLIITSELKKLDYVFNEKKNHFVPTILIESILILSSIAAIFFSQKIGLLLVGFSLYFGVVLAYYNFSFYQRKKILILQLPLYFVSLIGIMIIFGYIPLNYRPYLFLLPLFSQVLVSLYIVFYQKVIKKSKINPTLFDKID